LVRLFPAASNTLSPRDAARIYATIHGDAAPIDTRTPQAILRQAEKPLATSIKESIGKLSNFGLQGQALEFVGMMAYGTAEEASIFFQSWGVGTPRDLEGFPVGATQRQDAFFNTAMQAMGPLTKGISAFTKLDDVGNAARKRFTGGRILDDGDFDGAEGLYETIRKTDDVAAIVQHTGLPDFQVQRVKDHLFFNTHDLDDGLRRFDADPLIGNAWERLQSGSHTLNDISLFVHELFEAKFEAIFKQNYRTSHNAANRAGHLSGIE